MTTSNTHAILDSPKMSTSQSEFVYELQRQPRRNEPDRPRRHASPPPDPNDIPELPMPLDPWFQSAFQTDMIDYPQLDRRLETGDRIAVPRIRSAVDEPYRYIPPGPYLDAENEASYILSIDMARDLRRSESLQDREIGEYIYANYEPMTQGPNLLKDFGVYLAAAYAKHRAFDRFLGNHVPQYAHSHRDLRILLWIACNEWHHTLAIYKDDRTEVTDIMKGSMIRSEWMMSEMVFSEEPYILGLAHELNFNLISDLCDVNDYVRALWKPDREAIKELLSEFERALVRVKRREIDIRCLSGAFHEWLHRSGCAERWHFVQDWRDDTVRRANVLLCKTRYEVDFGFRSRKRYQSQDPEGDGMEDEVRGFIWTTEPIWWL